MTAQLIKIHFFGAAGTVTGSKFLLKTSAGNILVDCGMFQGLKELRLLNWEPFPFPPSEIDLILITHGHLDHTGFLPRLTKEGFKGKILGTAPTLAIAKVILEDSAQIQEEEAKQANEENAGTHNPALPLYTTNDAEAAINNFHPVEIAKWQFFNENIKYRFQPNGHILGSCFIELEIFGKIFLFSGDVGRETDILLDPPIKPQWADYLFLESTYGNRLHPPEETDDILRNIIHQVIEKKGNLIIPSFAVERMQTLMVRLWELYKERKIPAIPIFIDSPMGNNILEIFQNFSSWHKYSLQEFIKMQKHFQIITSYRDTWKTIDDKRSKIIIAGSGMVTGGRVLTYLRYLIEDERNTILLAGFQAEGTRGRQLLEGAHEIKIFGKYCAVKANILHIQSLSAHADQKELLDWVSEIKNIPEKVFLIHGEKSASDALRVKIKDLYNWKVHLPALNEEVEISIAEEVNKNPTQNPL